MSTPVFDIKVLENKEKQVTFQIAVVCEGGFDVTNPRDVMNALVYGTDMYFEDGRKSYDIGAVLEKELDFDKEFWNDDWLIANYKRFYREAKLISEINHPWDSNKQKFTEEQDQLRNYFSYADGVKLFNCADYPHCVVEITVTDERYINHLVKGMIYSIY